MRSTIMDLNLKVLLICGAFLAVSIALGLLGKKRGDND